MHYNEIDGCELALQDEEYKESFKIRIFDSYNSQIFFLNIIDALLKSLIFQLRTFLSSCFKSSAMVQLVGFNHCSFSNNTSNI